MKKVTFVDEKTLETEVISVQGVRCRSRDRVGARLSAQGWEVRASQRAGLGGCEGADGAGTSDRLGLKGSTGAGVR